MRNTLKTHKDFLFGDKAPTAQTDLFIAKMRPALFPGDGRYGLIVTKKTFKHAVKRNRAKRLLRVWIRLNDEIMSPEMDYIFIARRKILDVKMLDGAKTMADALRKLNKM